MHSQSLAKPPKKKQSKDATNFVEENLSNKTSKIKRIPDAACSVSSKTNKKLLKRNCQPSNFLESESNACIASEKRPKRMAAVVCRERCKENRYRMRWDTVQCLEYTHVEKDCKLKSEVRNEHVSRASSPMSSRSSYEWKKDSTVTSPASSNCTEVAKNKNRGEKVLRKCKNASVDSVLCDALISAQNEKSSMCTGSGDIVGYKGKVKQMMQDSCVGNMVLGLSTVSEELNTINNTYFSGSSQNKENSLKQNDQQINCLKFGSKTCVVTEKNSKRMAALLCRERCEEINQGTRRYFVSHFKLTGAKKYCKLKPSLKNAEVDGMSSSLLSGCSYGMRKCSARTPTANSKHTKVPKSNCGKDAKKSLHNLSSLHDVLVFKGNGKCAIRNKSKMTASQRCESSHLLQEPYSGSMVSWLFTNMAEINSCFGFNVLDESNRGFKVLGKRTSPEGHAQLLTERNI